MCVGGGGWRVSDALCFGCQMRLGGIIREADDVLRTASIVTVNYIAPKRTGDYTFFRSVCFRLDGVAVLLISLYVVNETLREKRSDAGICHTRFECLHPFAIHLP